MSKPIHLMRWAPADYVNDPAVKLALAQRDFVSSTFYPLFLFHAFIQGGTLPAEPVALGAILGMRPADVRRALAYWAEQGKVREEDGRLYHKRVKDDIQEELAYRETQAALGKLGGRPPKGSGSADVKGRVLNPESQPAPVPAPAPSPVPAPAPDPTPAALASQDRAAYVRAVWEAYCTARGVEPVIASGEFALVHEWADGGVPLRVVLGAMEATPQLREGKVRSLVYFRPVVAEAFERYVKATA